MSSCYTPKHTLRHSANSVHPIQKACWLAAVLGQTPARLFELQPILPGVLHRDLVVVGPSHPIPLWSQKSPPPGGEGGSSVPAPWVWRQGFLGSTSTLAVALRVSWNHH